jgi:hypothetical protein
MENNYEVAMEAKSYEFTEIETHVAPDDTLDSGGCAHCAGCDGCGLAI